jgi:nitroreductase
MDAITCILTRRSIRMFEKRAVGEELIRQVLEAGMMAPSAGNQQPWHFVVITDTALMAQVPRIHPYASMAPEAAFCVLVCGDPRLEKHSGFWVQDCSAAVQNMLLAAHALGLGGVWTGIHPDENRVNAFRRLFGLPDSVVPLALLPFGHPAQKSERVDRFRPERIHKNRW